MKVLVDFAAVSGDDRMRSGIVIYGLRNLIGFEALHCSDIHILVHSEKVGELSSRFPSFTVVPFHKCSCGPLRNLRDSLRWRRLLNASDYDVVFTPFTSKYYFWELKMPRVFSVHDLRTYHGCTIFRNPLYAIFMQIALRNSAKVVAISDFVREDILRSFRIKPEKVVTVHNGMEIPGRNGGQPSPFGFKYILSVNSLVPYKNTITLLEAYRKVRGRIGMKLVVVGRATKHWDSVLLPFIKDNGMQDSVVHVDFADDDYLDSLYAHASLFVSPSLYEGFGYTPVEAALHSVKAICTNVTSLPEVTMGMLDYYEPPADSDELAAKILEVLEKDQTELLEKRAKVFAGEYDIAASAAKVMSVVESAARG